jgi:curved DNA-binding protein CbpA
MTTDIDEVIQAHRLLELEMFADPEQVRKAFRKKASETHPDKGGNPSEFLRVQEAAALLIDPVSRQRHEDFRGGYAARSASRSYVGPSPPKREPARGYVGDPVRTRAVALRPRTRSKLLKLLGHFFLAYVALRTVAVVGMSIMGHLLH